MQESRKKMESKGKKVDEVHHLRMIPRWVVELAKKHGTEPSFIMAKKLTKTDLDRNQNHLLIHADFVKAHLIAFLTDNENAAANLLDYGLKRKNASTGAEHVKERKLKKMKMVEAGDGVKEQAMGEGEAAKEKVKMVGSGAWRAVCFGVCGNQQVEGMCDAVPLGCLQNCWDCFQHRLFLKEKSR